VNLRGEGTLRAVAEPHRPSLLLALTGLLCAAEARALEPPGFELELQTLAECPSRADIVRAIQASVSARPAEPLSVSATIAEDGDRWTLSVEWNGAPRFVQGDSCDAVSRALVAIVALAVDPAARVSDPDLGNNGGSLSGVAPAAAQPASPLATEAPAAPPQLLAPPRLRAVSPGGDQSSAAGRLQLGASLLALGESGALPEASYGVAAVLRASLEAWSAELGGSWLYPQWAQAAEVSARKGGSIGLTVLQATGCRALGRPTALCVGAEVGQLRGKGEGVADEDTGSSLWLAGALSASARLPLSSEFSAEARLVAAFPVYRPEFVIQPYSALHAPGWLSARLLLGIGFR
jgi:hypothetical protein